MASLKVATLVIKACIKPIANEFKRWAANEGLFRSSCNFVGQKHNSIMTRIQLRSVGHHAIKIKPLPEDEGVKSGADLIAETFVFTLGLGTILFEIFRKRRADKEAKRLQKIQEEEEKEAHQLMALEKETSLRRKLVTLEERLVSMENTKLTLLHDKIVKEQLMHLALTEDIEKRLGIVEDMLAVHVEKSERTLQKIQIDTILPNSLINMKVSSLDREFGSVESDVEKEILMEESITSIVKARKNNERENKDAPETEKDKKPTKSSNTKLKEAEELSILRNKLLKLIEKENLASETSANA